MKQTENSDNEQGVNVNSQHTDDSPSITTSGYPSTTATNLLLEISSLLAIAASEYLFLPA